MTEIDPLVLTYSHLPHLPSPSSALHLLRKIASLIKPLMRARGWRVRELGEFYPEQDNLLGLNINRGAKILLRLRYPSDKSLFLPLEQITDTMLHELAHIVHGPHDGKFHALWNQLRDEHEGLVMKGYTGEGFLGEGRRLSSSGGRRKIPMHEARRLAREQAEKRKIQTQQTTGSGGQRLGGARLRPGEDIRRVIIEAVERRNKTLKGCGVKDTGDEGLGEQEIRRIEEQATRNGFRSNAEEDEANEAAIAQALWELVQEDEKKKFGEGYVEPSREFPAGSQGAILQDEEKKGKGLAGPSSSSSKQPPPIFYSKPPATGSNCPPPPPSITEEPSNEHSFDGWACRICTLYNPNSFFCCDACGTKRPPQTSTINNSPTIPTSSKNTTSSSSTKSGSSTSKRPSSSVIDLTKSPPSVRTRASSNSHSSSKHSSSHRPSSSHGSSSKSQSKSASNSHFHSHSRNSQTASSHSEPRSETRPKLRSETSNSTSLKDLNNNLKREQKEKEKSKAKALLQAQAEADAVRLRLLTEKWRCSFCGKRMEKQWWTCSICGRMKDSSR